MSLIADKSVLYTNINISSNCFLKKQQLKIFVVGEDRIYKEIDLYFYG